MATATIETPQAAPAAQKPYVRGSHVSNKRGRTLAEIRSTVERRRLQMVAWRAMGYRITDIAEACGVSIGYVSMELQRAGYVRPERNLPPLPNMQKHRGA